MAISEPVYWEYPNFIRDDQPVYPQFGDDTVVIALEAGPMASLDWTQALADAKTSAAAGKRILWDLCLGLFEELGQPLSDKGQFFNLGLACDHFVEKAWIPFADYSIGCILYCGQVDFRGALKNDISLEANFTGWLFDHDGVQETVASYQLYLRDVAVSYLRLLGDRFPPSISLFATLSLKEVDSPLQQAMLLDRSAWKGIQPIPVCAESWEPLTFGEGRYCAHTYEEAPEVGVCLPATSKAALSSDKLNRTVSTLPDCYRWIPEEYLHTEWYGLEALLVDADTLVDQAVRKLCGFAAAGGVVVSLGGKLDVPNSKCVNQWLTDRCLK